MKRGNWKALHSITMALVAVFMLLVAAPVYALDPPHDTTNSINCYKCHNSAALTAEGVGDHIDNTPASMMCLNCHNGTDASLQTVHSAFQTGSEEWGGTWSHGCVDCHDPHNQTTARAYPTNYGAGGGARLDTGIVASLAAGTGGILNVVTVTGKSWTPGIHAGRVMQPDVRYSYYYRIVGNTGNVLYLDHAIKGYPTLANAGRTMAIQYGALTKPSVNAKRGVTNTGGYTVPGYSGGTRTVKYLNQTGFHSLANTETDTQAICIVCHTRTKVNNMGAALNAAQFSDVAPNYGSNSHITRTSNVSSCWTANGCHKTHADSFGTNCDTCHGQPPIDAASLVHMPEKPVTGRATEGKHLAHKNKGKEDCSLCHFGAGSDDADHINNVVMGIGFEYIKTGSYYRGSAMINGYSLAASNGNTTVQTLGGNRQCSNIYCHSNGGNFAGTFVNKTVDWDAGAAIGCDGCHGDGAGKLVITDRHAAHVETYAFKCFECHGNVTNASNAIVSQSLHVNNVKNVGFGNLSSASTFVYSHASGNCSNIYCHSNARGGAAAVTPNWGVAGPLACDDCHNTQGTTAAMSTNPLSSPHLKHNATDGAAGAGKYGDPTRGATRISCDQCHNTVVNEGGASLKNRSLHVNGTKNVSMNVADWPAGSGTATWNGSTCSNLYCHGNNLPGAYPGGTTRTPTWSGSATCGSCHGNPPGGAHPADSNCSPCHDGINVTNNGFTLGKEDMHLNGLVDTAANCGDCHGVPPQSTATMVTDPSTSGRTQGDHLIHKNYSATLADCYVCHKGGGFNNEGADNITHKAGVEIDMGFDVGGKTGGYYRSDWTALTNGYSIVSGDAVTAVANGGAAAPRTCDNIYCHSNGGDYTGSVTYKTSVNWDQTGVTACNFCHGDATFKVITDNHLTHIDFMGYKCYECHATVADPSNDGVIADKALHVNGAKNVAWGTLSSGGGAYARPNCSNNYCHSDGVNTVAPFNAANTMAAWDSGSGTSCVSCHDGDAVSGTPMATGAHNAHINDPGAVGWDLGCIDCHAQSVTNDTTINTTAPIKHVNKTKDVWVNIDNKTCSNIQCHSNGNFGGANFAYNNPAWSATMGCTNCHGDGATKSYPSYADGGQGTENSNTHNKHVGNSGLLCEQCHNSVSVDGTAADGVSPSSHVNQAINVDFKLGGAYDDVNERCSATYCHGGGQPYWGGAALDCAFCHDSSSTLPVRHDKHYATATAATSRDATNAHTASGYVFGCGNCHTNGATHATGMANQANHQTAEVSGTNQPLSGYTRGGSWAIDADGYEYTSNGTCTNSYCHSTGNVLGGSITYKTATWNAVATGNCTVCHDDDTTPLASNAHDVHILNATYNFTCEECHDTTVDGNATLNTQAQRNSHVDGSNTVAWKSTGLNNGATAYAQPNCSNLYCHSNGGDYSSAMTYRTIAWNGAAILCDDCHGNTTGNNVITNAHAKHAGPGASNYTYTCYECHSTVVTGAVTVATTTGGITSYVNHLNGTKNVAWGTLATGSPAYNKAGTDCTNIYCHSNGGNYAGTLTYANLEWNAATKQCDGCHGSGAGTNVLTNAHPGHVATATYGIKCYECHSSVVDGTVTVATTSGGITSIASHVNATKNVAWGTLASGAPAYNKAGTDCTNIYCHSNGGDYAGTKTYVNLEWNIAARQCDGCHGNQAGLNVNTNAHTKHVNAGTYAFKCYECHSTVVTGAVTVATTSGGISTYANHINNTKNVAWGTLSAGGSAYNKAGTDCGNIYCHSNGQAAPTYANLEWTAAATTCTSCHGQAGSTSTLGAAHATHTNAATANYGCVDCHTTVVSNNTTVSTYAKHVNATKEVAIPAGRGGTGTDGGDYGGSTCATTNCHGGVSKAWTANKLAIDNCTVCHGTETTDTDGNTMVATPWKVAPGNGGIDTDGHTVATDAQVGAHYAHLAAPTNYSNAMVCTDCHTVPATLNAAGHIDSTRPAEIVWSVLATTNAAPANYVSGTGVCSNVYCHDGYYFKNAWSTGAYDVTWGETTYLVGAIADCSKCHGNPPPDVTHGGNTDCSSCHTHVAANDISFVDKTIHVNGLVEGGGCTSCHGQPPVDTATLYSGSLGSTGRTTDYPANAWGSHATHTNAGTYNINCSNCHNGGQPSSGNHNSGTPTYLNIGFNVFSVTSGYYTAKDFADADFDLQAGGTTTLVVGAGNRLCNNIYCHSDGGDYAGTKTYKQGNWDSLGSMAGCDDCHGDGAGAKVSTNAHPKHANGGTNYAYACYECHSSTVNAGGTISNYPNHVNNTKEVAWGTLASGSPAYNKAGTDCTSVYCHSNGGDYAGTKTYVNLEWNAAARQCDGCHGNQAGINVSTNAHTKHIASGTYAMKCYECHSSVVNATVTVATTSGGISSTANHVNGTKTIAWGTLASGSPAYKSQANDCTNVYCHSNGQSTLTYANLNWNGAASTCTSCHGQAGSTSTLSGAHKTHTDAAGANYACLSCHFTTVSNNTTVSDYTRHVNATKNVAVRATAGGTGTDGGDYGGSTCTTTNCHGGLSKTWTANLSTMDNCTVCHGTETVGADGSTIGSTPWAVAPGNGGRDTDGNTVATDAQVGAHYNHLVAPTNYSSAIACVECHTVPAGVNTAGHIDSARPAEIVWGTIAKSQFAAAPSYTTGTGVCANLYCHDGYYFENRWSTGAYDVTWGETTYLVGAVADCSKCHGYPPPDTGTHNGNTDCSSCHNHVAAGDTTFSDKTKHVNGVNEASGGACNGCHGYPPQFGDTFTAQSTEGKGAHQVHITNLEAQYGVTRVPATDTFGNNTVQKLCFACHSSTSTHNNGTREMGIDAVYQFGPSNTAKYNGTQGVPGATTPKNCSSVECHVMTSPEWNTY